MRTILEMSHTNKEIEYKDLMPSIVLEERQLDLLDAESGVVHTFDLFDIVRVTFFP